MKKSFWKDEKFWTIFLGTIGCLALIWILINDPSDWPSILVNFAQIGVAVIVFFIAHNIFKNLIKKKTFGFNEKFEEHLKDWAEQNKYLIDTSEIGVPKGNEKRRSIQMICNHANMLNCSDANSTSSKRGSFLYLPKSDEFGYEKQTEGSQIEFKINKGMFETNNEIFSNYENLKKDISNKMDQNDHIEALSRADIGISGADYGLADTGTLVLRTSFAQDRSTTLSPPVHVAIIESANILAGSDDLIVRLLLDLEENGEPDSCLTLITGPSRTADIELNLVLGIHGPKDLRVIIV